MIMVVLDDGRWWVGLRRVSCDQEGLRGGGGGRGLEGGGGGTHSLNVPANCETTAPTF